MLHLPAFVFVYVCVCEESDQTQTVPQASVFSINIVFTRTQNQTFSDSLAFQLSSVLSPQLGLALL